MPLQYRVAQGGNIMAPPGSKRTIYKGGELVDEGDFPPQILKEHLRSGYLEPVTGNAMYDDKPQLFIGPDAPGVVDTMKDLMKDISREDEVGMRMGGGSGRSQSSVEDLQMSEAEAKAKGRLDGEKAPVKHLTPFMLSPASLQDKSLDQLNVMLQEREVDAVDTAQAAIDILSIDYED